jgi:hypothetical protein
MKRAGACNVLLTLAFCCPDPAARHSQRAAHITPHAYQPGYGYNTTSTQPAGPSSQFGRGQDRQSQQQSSTALVSSDGNSTALKTKEQPKMVQVRFWLKFHVDYGQTIRIIGGHDQLGELCVRSALQLLLFGVADHSKPRF